jgi:gliding motility-associated-like protein
MAKLLPYLFCFFGLLSFSPPAGAQCGFPVTLHTNKDYCVGSSIIASSTHAMQQITWYHNGQALDSATGTQSLSTQYVKVPIFPNPAAYAYPYNYTHLCSDNAGNIYCLFNQELLLKTTPSGAPSQIADFSTIPGIITATAITADAAGNIFVATGNIGTDATPVYEIPAGTISANAGNVLTAVPATANPFFNYNAAADFVDCNNNIYVYCPGVGSVYRYSPLTVSATVLGKFTGTLQNCGSWATGNMHADAAGNVFYLEGNSLMKLAPGSTAAVEVFSVSCTGDNLYAGDFWMDANDTAYLSVINFTRNTGLVEKWAPGASSGQQIASYPMGNASATIAPVTMDVRGNIWVAFSADPDLYEFKRTTAIDSTFTPADTGSYYAVVRDIQGFTTTSDTFHINAPSPGSPTIQITATATNTPVCTPITFTAQITNPGLAPSFQWQVSGIPAGGDSTTYSYNLFANGDEVYCILTTQAGCAGPIQDTSNILTLNIEAQGAASVTISTPKDSICQGDTAIFKATVAGGSSEPTFAWLVNGDSTSDNTDVFNGSNLSNGSVVTCLITSDDACGLAKSNSIPLTVSVPPAIESGQIFTVLHGHSLTLDPVTTGDIDSWLWTPATGLSDPTIANPIANPDTNTLYTLFVTAPGGCSATATILVNVYTPLSIPNAFTPNGDGHNDYFYVLGGPINSKVADFAVFDRFGAEIFHVHDVAPGDRTYAWNGTFHGTPAPAGTYVYLVVMKLASGTRQVYKGTVILIR